MLIPEEATTLEKEQGEEQGCCCAQEAEDMGWSICAKGEQQEPQQISLHTVPSPAGEHPTEGQAPVALLQDPVHPAPC